MKRIAVITATRAEYGLLTPLIKRIVEDDGLELDLIVTGGHLSEKQGHTIDAIQLDGFPISHQIPILDDDNDAYGISVTMANAIRGFAECFRDDRPDMAVILGDRTESLGVASAALNEQIPIAHIHGGEITQGAVDDCIRHALTKMSHLHFTSTEVYRRRVIQLGENPKWVFNVGGLGAENILTQPLLSKEELMKELSQIAQWGAKPYAVVTFHPVTLEYDAVEAQTRELCAACSQRQDIFFLITAANADRGGDFVNQILKEYCKLHRNASFTYNLGMRRYLSAIKHAAFVIGNSSSGILEAPVLGTPTVNIGDRQTGRLKAGTVIDCEPKREKILSAITEAASMEHVPSNLYGDGSTSRQMIHIIKCFLDHNQSDVKKQFYDMEMIYERGKKGETK